MRNNLEIITIDGKLALIDGFESIKSGCTVINKNGTGVFKTAVKNENSIGYIGHGGYSFLYFRQEIHRRFIKYITKSDLKKLLPVKRRSIKCGAGINTY